jgi:hypothetical protein
MKMKAVDLSPITAELPGAALGLFRHCNKSILPGEKILNEDEKTLHENLLQAAGVIKGMHLLPLETNSVLLTFSIKTTSMKELVIKIKESRYNLFLQFLRTLDYVTIMPPVAEPSNEGYPKPGQYDFSDLTGRLEWRGDAVGQQRLLRDEW